MSDNFGPGIVGGVVLVDPVTGLPYKAEGGGGGGAVDSVNGQTGAVVLDAEDVGAVPSAEGDTYRVYGTDTSGVNTTFLLEGLNPLPVTVPMRTETGAIATATPTDDNHAASKEYVDIRVPVPPESGTYTLQSVDGVTSWVAVTP